MSVEKIIYYTYSDYEKKIANKIPSACSNCDWTEKYAPLMGGPWRIVRTETEIGTHVEVVCPKCKYSIDVTPYENW